VSLARDESDDLARRLARLKDEVDQQVRKRDLAADGDERGDAHHHPAEAATDADLREGELRAQLKWRERQKRLQQVQEALAKGTYGVCVDCGQPIPEARLRAVPDAIRCVPCQSASAHKR
jgi:phage/conjugal plasmid C-4 type zinc finger TraR family protein